MNVDAVGLEKEVVEWVVNWNEGEMVGDINPDSNLLGTGILDSMGLAGLVAYLEDRLDTEFDYSEVDLSGEVSIRMLVAHCLESQVRG